MIKHITNLIIILILWIIQVPFILLGVLVVPLALLFRKKGISIREGWKTEFLPPVFWLWDNKMSGAWGDKGWRTEHHPDDYDKFWVMWWWLAIRNPINNLTYFMGVNGNVIGKKVWGNEETADIIGREGWTYNEVRVEGEEIFYPQYYIVFPYRRIFKHRFFEDKCVRILLGWKNFNVRTYDLPKMINYEFTISVNPLKELRRKEEL